MVNGSSEQPESGMLGRAAAGDARAWGALVERYTPRVYSLLLGRCGDGELAEELTQATFVKLVQSIGRYEEQGRFEAWLFRIAMNLLRDEMRRRKRRRGLGGAAAGQPSDSGSGLRDSLDHLPRRDERGPLETLSRAEQIEDMKRAIAQLSDAEQLLLELRHTAGLTFPQIARTLDQPLGTVLARGHRALAKLRSIMNGQAPVRPDRPAGRSTQGIS